MILNYFLNFLIKTESHCKTQTGSADDLGNLLSTKLLKLC